MADHDPHHVREMNWMELEFYADGHDPMREKVAHARAEIRRREAEERDQERKQRAADVTRRISSNISLQKERIEADKSAIEMQTKLSQELATKHLRIARASAWASGFAALATLMIALISALQFLGAGR